MKDVVVTDHPPAMMNCVGVRQ
jgi:hypothetical protein